MLQDYEPLVSIIIPAYNTEKYIGRMLECVIHQTYKNMEIIVIDDGSTDETEKIIKNYMRKDGRIQYIYQDHEGVSKARNLGIKMAQGGKVFFLDSDDTLEYSLIEKCIFFSKEKNVNSVLYGYADKQDGVVKNIHETELSGVYKDDDIRKKVMPHFIGHSYEDINRWITHGNGLRRSKEHTALWRIMLDMGLIRENELFFDEKLSLGEDTKFINQYFLFETSIGYLDECLYYLTIREGSANVTNNENVDLMVSNKLKLVEARKELDLLAHKLYGMDLHQYWEGTIVLSAMQIIVKYALEHQGKLKENYKKCKKFINYAEVLKGIKGFRLSWGGIEPFLFLC